MCNFLHVAGKIKSLWNTRLRSEVRNVVNNRRTQQEYRGSVNWECLEQFVKAHPLPIVWHLSELHREITGHSKDRWWNQSALGHSLLSRALSLVHHTHTHKSARIGVGMTLHGLVCQTYSAMEIMCFGSRNVWKERKTLQSETMKSVILNIFTTHSDALLHIST